MNLPVTTAASNFLVHIFSFNCVSNRDNDPSASITFSNKVKQKKNTKKKHKKILPKDI